MRNYLRLIKYVLKYYYYLLPGIFFMIGYALFSSISISIIVPLMDDVFNRSANNIVKYHHLSEFLFQIKILFFKIFNNINQFFFIESYKVFVSDIRKLFRYTDPEVLLIAISVFMLSAILLKNIFFYLNRIMFINIEGLTAKSIRDSLFKKFLTGSLSFFHNVKSGDILVRIIDDAQIINKMMISIGMKIIRDILTICGFLIIALSLNSSLFFKVILVIPILGIVLSYIGKKLKKYSKRIRIQFATMFSKIEEIIWGIKIVKAFAKEHIEYKRFRNITLQYFRSWRKLNFYDSLNKPFSEISSIIMGLVVLWLGGREVLDPNNTFSFGEFMGFLGAIFSMLDPMKQITKGYNEIKKARVSLDRIFEILDIEEKDVEQSGSLEIKDFTDKIEFKNVFFAYNNNDYILRNINFTINKGEKVAIVGKSGSGKTSLIYLLLKFFKPTKGKIVLDGHDISDFNTSQYRRLFGYVPQDLIIFNSTIRENIAYSISDIEPIDEEKLKKAAVMSHSYEFIKELENGFETIIKEYGNNFSGGQKQRLSIARAIYNNPQILIFDEATSSLDTESEKIVQEAINEIMENRTVIIIAHRLSTIQNADKIIVLKDGDILDIGTHDELFSRNDYYKMLFNLSMN